MLNYLLVITNIYLVSVKIIFNLTCICRYRIICKAKEAMNSGLTLLLNGS